MSWLHFPKFRFLGFAAFRCIGAATAEAASAGGIHRAGHVTAEQLLILFYLRVRFRDGRNQCLSIGVLCVPVYGIAVGQFHQLAQIHYPHPV